MCTHTHTHTHTQVIGLGILATAIYLLASQNDFDFVTGSRFYSLGVLILVAGFITAIVSLCGVVGGIGMWRVLLIIVSHVTLSVVGIGWSCDLECS